MMKITVVEFFALSLVVFQVLRLSSGHSWLACTDYAEKNGGDYDHNKCRGYARSALKLAKRNGVFGSDTGFDYHPQESSPCRNERNDATEYDGTHPMAVYYQGQQVVLAHPMKNHGSDTCTNAFIPDNGNYIYRGEKDAASDPTMSDFRENKVANLGTKNMSLPYSQYPKQGYQNAPKFCDNTDKSLGTYSFNVPKDLTPGQYTFFWLWAFNGAGDLYSSCFEVNILATREERNLKLAANGFTNFYEPCGGKTSDFDIDGNTNPGCSNEPGGTTLPPDLTTISTSTNPAATTATATTPTTTASTTANPGEEMLVVQTVQMVGRINLPEPLPGTLRRFFSVHWGCPVIANFWNTRVIAQRDVNGGKEKHYDLMQEGQEIDQRIFYYHASFQEPCSLLAYPPVAKWIRDEI